MSQPLHPTPAPSDGPSRRTVLAASVAGSIVLGGCMAPRRDAPSGSGWSPLPDLPVGVAKFALAARGGRLFVMGGYDTLQRVWVLDPAAGRWQAGPPLPRGTDNAAGATVGDEVLAIGGEAGRALQRLDASGTRWSSGPDAPAVHFGAAAAVRASLVHVAGGWNADNRASASLVRHDVYDAAAASWRTAAPLAVARNAAGAATLAGRVWVVGGRAPGIRRGDQSPLASVEAYDPAADRWTAAAPLPIARGSLAVAALGAHVYAFGGEEADGRVSARVDRYDPGRDRWESLPPMPHAAHGLGAVTVGDAIIVVGGYAGGSDAVGTERATAWRYVPPA
ncbi:MAG: hypothetical protein JNN18_23705 [Rubrivivax sp.]|nr:hypothetical protein [Rubrivivax sp.]